MAPSLARFPLITRRQGVRSGVAIVAGTRIGVHDVIGLLQNGETMETPRSRCFPRITQAQFKECLAYYDDHRDEIDGVDRAAGGAGVRTAAGSAIVKGES